MADMPPTSKPHETTNKESFAQRLALGTAQFGLNYGIANKSGQVSAPEAEAMISLARQAGIDTLDTAIAYGTAEHILGQLGVSDFKIISKIPSIKGVDSSLVADWVQRQIENSLNRLKISKLQGLLLHSPQDLLGPAGNALALGVQRAKDTGLVQKIGVSLYSAEQLEYFKHKLNPDIVQIPSNVLDRRFEKSGWLNWLHSQGIEIHSRSAFLQGLLLLSPNNIPQQLKRFDAELANWHNWLSSQVNKVSAVEACLAHVKSYSEISRIVVGADNHQQLESLISAISVSANRAPMSLNCDSEELINPSRWS